MNPGFDFLLIERSEEGSSNKTVQTSLEFVLPPDHNPLLVLHVRKLPPPHVEHLLHPHNSFSVKSDLLYYQVTNSLTLLPQSTHSNRHDYRYQCLAPDSPRLQEEVWVATPVITIMVTNGKMPDLDSLSPATDDIQFSRPCKDIQQRPLTL